MKIRNFTPVIDGMAKEYGLVRAAIWGRIWRYEQGTGGSCQASHESIADGLGVSAKTVSRHIAALIEDGFIIDHTPDLRNKPHTYNTTEKAVIEFIAVGRTESPSKSDEIEFTRTESPSQTDRESDEESIKVLKDSLPSNDDGNRANGKTGEIDHNSIRLFAEQAFRNKTGLSPLPGDTKRIKGQNAARWYSPLRTICEIGEWNTNFIQRLIIQSVDDLGMDKVYAPQSILTTVQKLAARMTATQKETKPGKSGGVTI